MQRYYIMRIIVTRSMSRNNNKSNFTRKIVGEYKKYIAAFDYDVLGTKKKILINVINTKVN